jgi:hypothetical protein
VLPSSRIHGSNPEKAGHAQIDLVDQGEIFVTFGVLDFVDADGVNLAEDPVFEAQVTTCSTASKTLSQEVRNTSAVSFQDSRRAQRARNSMLADVDLADSAPGVRKHPQTLVRE